MDSNFRRKVGSAFPHLWAMAATPVLRPWFLCCLAGVFTEGVLIAFLTLSIQLTLEAAAALPPAPGWMWAGNMSRRRRCQRRTDLCTTDLRSKEGGVCWGCWGWCHVSKGGGGDDNFTLFTPSSSLLTWPP